MLAPRVVKWRDKVECEELAQEMLAEVGLAEPISAQDWGASLTLGFERREQRTVLASQRHAGPLVVQKPLYPEGGAVAHGIVVHPPVESSVAIA